jgi:hypothetical protein
LGSASERSEFMICPLCGHAFDESAESACRKCPLKPDCRMVCCPQCGYQTVTTAPITEKAVGMLKRLLGRKREKP